ncbi:hypothetical protein RE428_31960 [Marinobacter nanhaiticus D15-8W]|uniref:Uncharacterized protein n=1 Tax=Marinobacter nanhaiticus D15-8W TaxID=626887 RepID=N6W9D7_9GAMM|nr:hypothetical protein [Marinobacter nanhaiticus]ENO16889.1 hypothetical protein J057_01755 [Marinobacter nanhaiticus D15-8W]BES72178.1 hypothetical protein RE428_31960 [Marinobacter nanhaiticus D15-8W]
MTVQAKIETAAQNIPYAGSAVIAGGSILTFNQWMGLLGLLFSIAIGIATYLFNVRMQKRRERREIELHRKLMGEGDNSRP